MDYKLQVIGLVLFPGIIVYNLLLVFRNSSWCNTHFRWGIALFSIMIGFSVLILREEATGKGAFLWLSFTPFAYNLIDLTLKMISKNVQGRDFHFNRTVFGFIDLKKDLSAQDYFFSILASALITAISIIPFVGLILK